MEEQLDVDGKIMAAWKTPAIVALVLMPIFAATATWSLPYHADALTNAISGWYWGVERSPVATDHEELAVPEQFQNTTFFVVSPRGPVSQYPPGAALTVAPFQALAHQPLEPARLFGSNDPTVPPVETSLPPIWPATLSAVLVSAAACATIGRVAVEVGFDTRRAVVIGVTSGLATGAWSITSNMSWTHGPAVLAVSLGMFASARRRWLLAGLAFGAGILTRPHVAVVALAVGMVVAWSRRSWRPMVLVGAGSGLGLALLLGYNRYIWQSWTISGGMGEGFQSNLMSPNLFDWLGNVALGLAALDHGLLPWAPFLLVLLPAAWRRRAEMPDWALAGAVGGGAYLLLQWKANHYAGGSGFHAYRYPLEALAAFAPVLVVALKDPVLEEHRWHLALVATVGAAIAGQAVGAVLT